MDNDECDILKVISSGTKSCKKVGEYILHRSLGQGGQARVFHAKKLNDGLREYALKQFGKSNAKDRSSLSYVKAEVAVMRKINHINILKSYEILETNNNFYLVLEYCNQGNLSHYLKNKKLHEKEAVFYFKQIINGLFELRKNRILHRDIKFENLLVHDNIIKIADFGFAVADDIGNEYLGTLSHMAPEILFYGKDRIRYDYKADLWSTGVVFFEMLNGYLPFQKRTKSEIQKEIEVYSEKSLRFANGISSEATNLLQRLLTIETAKRISWEEFYNHELFKKYGEINMNSVIQSAIHEGFEKNKKEVQGFQELEYWDIQEVLKMASDEAHSIQAKKVEENNINDNAAKRLVLADCLREIQYRYFHEANKISFLLKTAQNIFKFVIDDAFRKANFHLLNVALLILKKAMVDNELILRSIMYSKNKLKINNDLFEFIIKIISTEPIVSSKIEDIRKCFAILDKIQLYMDDIFKLASEKKICLIYQDILDKDNPGEYVLNNRISNEFDELVHYAKKQDLKQLDGKCRQFLVILLFIHFCIFSDKRFPYLVDKTALKKFNFDKFYYDYDTMDTKQLQIELAHIQQKNSDLNSN